MSYKANYIGYNVVGYRYGVAPSNNDGYVASRNHRDGYAEPGVSLAGVLRAAPVCSFAVSGRRTSQKHYYQGTIVGIGSDGEYCLDPATLVEISWAEYRSYCACHHGLSDELNSAQEKDCLAAYPVDLDGFKSEKSRNIAICMRCCTDGEPAAFAWFIEQNQRRRDQIAARFTKFYYKKKVR